MKPCVSNGARGMSGNRSASSSLLRKKNGSPGADHLGERKRAGESEAPPAFERLRGVPVRGDDLDRLPVVGDQADQPGAGLRGHDSLGHDGVQHLLRRDGLRERGGRPLEPDDALRRLLAQHPGLGLGDSRPLGRLPGMPKPRDDLGHRDRGDDERREREAVLERPRVDRPFVVLEEVVVQKDGRESTGYEPGRKTPDRGRERDREHVEQAREDRPHFVDRGDRRHGDRASDTDEQTERESSQVRPRRPGATLATRCIGCGATTRHGGHRRSRRSCA